MSTRQKSAFDLYLTGDVSVKRTSKILESHSPYAHSITYRDDEGADAEKYPT
jgi:hypothetical protein